MKHVYVAPNLAKTQQLVYPVIVTVVVYSIRSVKHTRDESEYTYIYVSVQNNDDEWCFMVDQPVILKPASGLNQFCTCDNCQEPGS